MAFQNINSIQLLYDAAVHSLADLKTNSNSQNAQIQNQITNLSNYIEKSWSSLQDYNSHLNGYKYALGEALNGILSIQKESSGEEIEEKEQLFHYIVTNQTQSIEHIYTTLFDIQKEYEKLRNEYNIISEQFYIYSKDLEQYTRSYNTPYIYSSNSLINVIKSYGEYINQLLNSKQSLNSQQTESNSIHFSLNDTFITQSTLLETVTDNLIALGSSLEASEDSYDALLLYIQRNYRLDQELQQKFDQYKQEKIHLIQSISVLKSDFSQGLEVIPSISFYYKVLKKIDGQSMIQRLNQNQRFNDILNLNQNQVKDVPNLNQSTLNTSMQQNYTELLKYCEDLLNKITELDTEKKQYQHEIEEKNQLQVNFVVLNELYEQEKKDYDLLSQEYQHLKEQKEQLEQKKKDYDLLSQEYQHLKEQLEQKSTFYTLESSPKKVNPSLNTLETPLKIVNPNLNTLETPSKPNSPIPSAFQTPKSHSTPYVSRISISRSSISGTPKPPSRSISSPSSKRSSFINTSHSISSSDAPISHLVISTPSKSQLELSKDQIHESQMKISQYKQALEQISRTLHEDSSVHPSIPSYVQLQKQLDYLNQDYEDLYNSYNEHLEILEQYKIIEEEEKAKIQWYQESINSIYKFICDDVQRYSSEYANDYYPLTDLDQEINGDLISLILNYLEYLRSTQDTVNEPITSLEASQIQQSLPTTPQSSSKSIPMHSSISRRSLNPSPASEQALLQEKYNELVDKHNKLMEDTKGYLETIALYEDLYASLDHSSSLLSHSDVFIHKLNTLDQSIASSGAGESLQEPIQSKDPLSSKDPHHLRKHHLKHLVQYIRELEQTLEEFKKKNQESQDLISQQNEQITELRSKNKDILQQYNELDTRYQDIQNLVNSKTDVRNEELNVDFSLFNRGESSNTLNTEISKLLNNSRNLSIQNKSLTTRLSHLQYELNYYRDKYTQLQEEYTEYKGQYHRYLEKEIEYKRKIKNYEETKQKEVQHYTEFIHRIKEFIEKCIELDLLASDSLHMNESNGIEPSLTYYAYILNVLKDHIQAYDSKTKEYTNEIQKLRESEAISNIKSLELQQSNTQLQQELDQYKGYLEKEQKDFQNVLQRYVPLQDKESYYNEIISSIKDVYRTITKDYSIYTISSIQDLRMKISILPTKIQRVQLQFQKQQHTIEILKEEFIKQNNLLSKFSQYIQFTMKNL